MKIKYLPYSFVLLLLTTACQTNRCCDDVVCETYVHRYGVPLDPEDWSARGQHGQVVSTRKDGVVVTKSYDGGVLDGETTYTYPNQDIIYKRENYQRGSLTQEVWCYPNGMPQRQTVYESPTNQTQVIWYETGAPQCKEVYENGRLVRGEYLTTTNQTESVVDEGNGTRTRRDGYGQLTSIDVIQEGQMVSSSTYHPNGAPASLTPYVNGVIQGQRRTFLPSGEPLTIEEWTNNCQHGKTIVFQNGEKLSEVPYVRGKRHGIERCYKDETVLSREVTWVNDQKQGPCHSYLGEEKKTDWYWADKQVSRDAYNAYKNQQ